MKNLISKCCNEKLIWVSFDKVNGICSKCNCLCEVIETKEEKEEVKEGTQGITNMEEIMTDMFGEGGKEEVKEAFKTPTPDKIEEVKKQFYKQFGASDKRDFFEMQRISEVWSWIEDNLLSLKSEVDKEWREKIRIISNSPKSIYRELENLYNNGLIK
jgi:hypothetical protein